MDREKNKNEFFEQLKMISKRLETPITFDDLESSKIVSKVEDMTTQWWKELGPKEYKEERFDERMPDGTAIWLIMNDNPDLAKKIIKRNGILLTADDWTTLSQFNSNADRAYFLMTWLRINNDHLVKIVNDLSKLGKQYDRDIPGLESIATQLRDFTSYLLEEVVPKIKEGQQYSKSTDKAKKMLFELKKALAKVISEV